MYNLHLEMQVKHNAFHKFPQLNSDLVCLVAHIGASVPCLCDNATVGHHYMSINKTGLK